MRVTWQADDIKAGVELAHNISPNGNHKLFYVCMDDGVRYCVSLEGHGMTPPMTKEEMASYLNERGCKPAVLLTL